jgi:hypothetical protein
MGKDPEEILTRKERVRNKNGTGKRKEEKGIG